MTTSSAPQPRSRLRWRLALGVVLSLGALALALCNRQWILEAIQLVETARPLGLSAALLIILASFLTGSQVLRLGQRALGHIVGVLLMWATALVAIVLSQLLPAGGLSSYAFLLRAFRRYGATPAEAALVPTLEGLSYTVAMVLFATFGLAELAAGTQAEGSSRYSLAAALLAPSIQIALYRVNQEAINNIAKHAAASQATITGQCDPDQVELRITDNGRGFDPSAVAPGSLVSASCASAPRASVRRCVWRAGQGREPSCA